MKEKEQSDRQKAFFQEWLEKLQQESWQLELLISGFALYGVYGSRSWISELSNYIDVHTENGAFEVFARMLVMVLEAGWVLFFINLLIHIVFRGLWIGAIGLRYVSRDIEYDELNYSQWMTDYLKRKVGHYDDYIERLEKLCSVLFAYTFLLFFLVVSVISFFSVLIVFEFLLAKVLGGETVLMRSIMGITVLIYLFFALIVFIDFITLGTIRRIKDKTFSRLYGYVYRFYSYVTLSFLYRALLYNFLDSRYTRRLFLLGIPYIIAVLLIAPTIYTNGHSVVPSTVDMPGYLGRALRSEMIVNRYYDDLRAEAEERLTIKRLSIDKLRYEGGLMQIFFRISSEFDEVLRGDAAVQGIFKTGVGSDFWSPIEDNPAMDSLDLLGDEAIAAIAGQRSEARSQLRDRGKYVGPVKDSLKQHYQMKIDSVERVVEDLKVAYYRQQIGKVKKAMSKRVLLSVDGQRVAFTADQLLFGEHINMGELGAFLHLPIDTLSQGLHRLHYERVTGPLEKAAQGSRCCQVTIPFYIED